jgi:hypothetical protein
LTLSKKFQASGLLSTGDVARELNVHRSTVWLWIKQGSLKKSTSDGQTGVHPRDLAKFRAVYHVNGEKEKKSA